MERKKQTVPTTCLEKWENKFAKIFWKMSWNDETIRYNPTFIENEVILKLCIECRKSDSNCDCPNYWVCEVWFGFGIPLCWLCQGSIVSRGPTRMAGARGQHPQNLNKSVTVIDYVMPSRVVDVLLHNWKIM